MNKPNYEQLYNVVIDYSDASDIVPIGQDVIGEDGNPFGFSKLEDAMLYRNMLIEGARSGIITDVKRVYVIVGERVPV